MNPTVLHGSRNRRVFSDVGLCNRGDELVPDLKLDTKLLPDASTDSLPASIASSYGSPFSRKSYGRLSEARGIPAALKRTGSLPGSPASQYLSRINSRLSLGDTSSANSSANVSGVNMDHEISGFRLGPILGSGGFSVVRRAWRVEDDEELAIKIVDKRLEGSMLEREISIWRSLHHPNILELIEVHETSKAYYLVTPLIEGNLYEFIRDHRRLAPEQMPIDTINRYLRQLVDAVAYMHSQNIIHRDIKPENCLLSKKHGLLLCDFGLSQYIGEDVQNQRLMGPAPTSSQFRTTNDRKYDTQFGVRTRADSGVSKSNNENTQNCGSYLFAAPEMLSSSQLSPKIDVWALGVTAYTALCGQYPWKHSFWPKLKEMIINDDYDEKNIPAPARKLISACLQKDPAKRATITEVSKLVATI